MPQVISQYDQIATLPDVTGTRGASKVIARNASDTGYQWSDLSSGGSTLPVADTTAIAKGSADATKQVRFDVSGLTTGTTRVLTVPDNNLTLAGTDVAQTFSAAQSFAAGVNLTLGAALAAFALSSTSTSRQQYDVTPAWATSTDASRKARVVFSVWDTAAREFIRAEATGTGATVEFRGGVVGIGTSSTPTQKLQVVGGNILIDGSRALHLGDTNWGIGRDIVAETGGALSSNTLQVKVGSLSTQGFQIVNSSNATLVEVRGSNGQAILRGGVQLTLSTYADNAAAVAGGLATDAVYKTTTGELRIVV